MTSRMRIIFACSYLSLFFLIRVFNCLSFARISTYGIHVVCGCFLVWYLYFYCACVFCVLFCFLNLPLISAVIGFLAVVTAFQELCYFCWYFLCCSQLVQVCVSQGCSKLFVSIHGTRECLGVSFS